MNYLILFLEGIITFISPCILPMLPLYISYFIGDISEDDNANSSKHKLKAFINSLGFVLGFSITFVLLGALAGVFGSFIFKYNKIINIVLGIILIFFGLSYLEIIKVPFLQKSYKIKKDVDPIRFGKAVLFGIIFSIGWTPCVGTFLSSALIIASNSKTALEGSLMLLSYSLGLGIPFIISSILLKNLMSTFNFLKNNYKTLNKISGIFLILMGIFMMTGYLEKFLGMFN